MLPFHYFIFGGMIRRIANYKGNLWLRGTSGLYRIKKSGEIIKVTTRGPWK